MTYQRDSQVEIIFIVLFLIIFIVSLMVTTNSFNIFSMAFLLGSLLGLILSLLQFLQSEKTLETVILDRSVTARAGRYGKYYTYSIKTADQKKLYVPRNIFIHLFPGMKARVSYKPFPFAVIQKAVIQEDTDTVSIDQKEKIVRNLEKNARTNWQVELLILLLIAITLYLSW